MSSTNIVFAVPTVSAATSIQYQVVATDSYSTGTSTSSIVNFYNLIWYGPEASAPTDSNSIRSLPYNALLSTLGSPFILSTSNVYNNFSIALPTPHTVSGVIDLDALNASITYVLSAGDVYNRAGTATSYNIYTLTNAIPYTASHRHQITWS